MRLICNEVICRRQRRLYIKSKILVLQAKLQLEQQGRVREEGMYKEFASLPSIQQNIRSFIIVGFQNCLLITSLCIRKSKKINYLQHSLMGQQILTTNNTNEEDMIDNEQQNQKAFVSVPSHQHNNEDIKHFVSIDKVPQMHPVVKEILEKIGDFKPTIIHFQGIPEPKAYTISNEELIYDINCEWKDGLPYGFGRLIYKDQSLFTGFFENGVPQGQGRYISSQGWYYEGEIRRQHAQGKGVFCYDKIGYFYEGDWLSNLPNGNGRQTWTKDERTSSYEGQFANGQKNGMGKYISEDQWEYEGQFVKNKITTSKGFLKYKNGQTYEGGFNDGKKHGFGIYKWTNGSYFQGWYSQDKKQGHGKFTINENKIFEGEWRDGKRQGYGILSIGQKMYSGIWQNDKIISKEQK